MTRFAERHPIIVGAIGILITAAVLAGAVEYDRLPFLNTDTHYTAYFAEAGGIKPGAAVQVSGLRAGQVTDVALVGNRVAVEFDVDKAIFLGDRTEAAVKTKTLLGAKILEITPRGEDVLQSAIPIERTTPAYELADALGDLSTTIADLNTTQLSDSLSTLAETFRDTPPDVQLAVQGLTRFSQSLDTRDQQLRDLLTHAEKATSVLAHRSDDVVRLVADANALLLQLQDHSVALDRISHSLTTMSEQISSLAADNRTQLRAALDKLNGVLTIVDNRKERVQKSITLLNQYALSLGESVSSGPFFKAYLVNLIPGQFIQPFIDAAFSDLGLDPNVLLPSQRSDPQLGQPGTPALPVPYPRTGQGGDPRLTLPDAITGNLGDSRYPYREPPPAPPPGGPPPGPPATPPTTASPTATEPPDASASQTGTAP